LNPMGLLSPHQRGGVGLIRSKVLYQTQISKDELIRLFLDDIETRGVTIKTVKNYGSCLKIFFNNIQKHPFEITISDFIAFLKLCKKRNYTESTINNYFSAFYSFFDYLEFEEYIDKSIVPKFRKRYLKNLRRRYRSDDSMRKLISVEEMSRYVNSIIDPRDKAVVVLLAKTGIRRGELINIDVGDINWVKHSIELKPKAKRTNRIVFFDDECARVLKRWLNVRDSYNKKNIKALFINERGQRLQGNGILNLVTKYAERLGLHDPESERIEDHFTPHCFRHWFTTHLMRNGMPREYVKELRGDSRGEAIDIYHHIDKKDLRERYLACIPKLGI